MVSKAVEAGASQLAHASRRVADPRSNLDWLEPQRVALMDDFSAAVRELAEASVQVAPQLEVLARRVLEARREGFLELIDDPSALLAPIGKDLKPHGSNQPSHSVADLVAALEQPYECGVEQVLRVFRRELGATKDRRELRAYLTPEPLDIERLSQSVGWLRCFGHCGAGSKALRASWASRASMRSS